MPELIRVIVVDDSPIFAQAMQEALNTDPEICVVGVATNGQQAVWLTEQLRPDLITMDIQMPVMDGLEAIERIMSTWPTPILVLTGDPRLHDGGLSFEALRRGALDIKPKPAWLGSRASRPTELIEQIKLLAGVMVIKHPRLRPAAGEAGAPAPPATPLMRPEPLPPLLAAPSSTGQEPARVIGLVSSTGGPAALAQILEATPADLPAALLAVQHIAPGFAPSLAAWLDQVSPLRVKLAEHGEEVVAGTLYLAPEGVHLVIAAGNRVALRGSPPEDGYRPSGTLLLASLAEVLGPRAAGVILTGMGADGVAGLQAIRRAGGLTVAQDEATSVVYGMPRAAVELGAARWVVPLPSMAATLCRLAGMGV